MKSTVELPEPLLRRAKRCALERRTTLRRLIIEGLEATTASDNSRTFAPEDGDFLMKDAYGVSVLKANQGQSQTVTNATIDEIREELEI